MNRFDEELRSALTRREPPEGFTDRLMTRIPDGHPRRSGFPRSWMPAAAAVLIAVLGAGSWEYSRAREQRLEGERAKAELIYALQVTSTTLQATRAKLLRQTGGRI